MSDLAMMSLNDVEKCNECYIVYEYGDSDSHLFKRLRTDDENILFERQIQKFWRSQPYLSKDKYGILWFAFADRPRQCVVDKMRLKIKDYVRRNMPWLM